MADLSFRCGPAQVLVSDAGLVRAVAHDATPESPLLLETGDVLVSVAGRPVAWGPPLLLADADEVEVSRAAADLHLVVRHSFRAGWGVRVALTNTGPVELVLDDPVLSWRLPQDRPTWALAAGAAASCAVLPPAGTGPLLGGVLRLGAVTGASPAGLHLGRIVLRPSDRYVVQWQWDFYPGPREFDRGRHPDVPRRLVLAVGESATIAAGEDEALVVEPGLLAETTPTAVALSAGSPGTYRVELRSARGLIGYELRVAEPVEMVLPRVAGAALAQPRTASGVVPLPGPDAALAVQRALVRSLLDDVVEAEEALDLYRARLPEEPPTDPRLIAFLCGEHVRTGDPDALDLASRAVLASAAPRPGLGLAAAELCLARVLADQPVASVLDHLARLVAGTRLAPAAAPLAAQAGLLELELVTMLRDPAGSVAGSAAVTARAVALGGWLGAGLQGRAVAPLPPDAVAHLAAVLALLPEPVSAALRTSWGCTAHELARQGALDALWRADGDRPSETLTWLVLAERAA